MLMEKQKVLGSLVEEQKKIGETFLERRFVTVSKQIFNKCTKNLYNIVY